MANILDRNFDFATNGTVTAAGLHNLIDETNIYAGLISTQEEKTTVGTSDLLLVADSSSISSPQIAANRTTVYNLFEDALTGGTYVNAQLSGNLTYGTATGQRTISTGATITNGTITNGTITNGTIANAVIPSGTFGTTTSTAATITNLSTTLAGDFTISQGTGTLGTTGATAETYGTTNAIPRITVDAKGRVTSASTVTNPVGFRNRIINGDMRIDQRNASGAITPSADTYLLDRFVYSASQASKFTWQQNKGSITPPAGFSNYLGGSVATAVTIGASDYFGLVQKIEAFNVADLGWGTSNAKTVTLSFKVYSSLTGTFGGSLTNSGSTRSYPFTYSIPTANTWTTVSIVIAGDISGTWLTTNGIGISVQFGLGVGSTYSGTAGSWAGTQYISATGAVSVVGTVNATFYITGIQLEEGSTATDFERRPIGTELALCQRYFEVGNSWLQVTGAASSAGMGHQFSVQKRVASTNTFTNITYDNSSGLTDFSSSMPSPLGTTALSFYFIPNAAGSAVRFNWGAAAEL